MAACNPNAQSLTRLQGIVITISIAPDLVTVEIFESFVEKAVVVARFSKVPEVLNGGQDLSFQVTDDYPLPLQNPSSLIDRSEHRQPTVSTAPGRDPSVVEACSQILQGGCRRAQRVHVDCGRAGGRIQRAQKFKNQKHTRSCRGNTHAVGRGNTHAVVGR